MKTKMRLIQAELTRILATETEGVCPSAAEHTSNCPSCQATQATITDATENAIHLIDELLTLIG